MERHAWAATITAIDARAFTVVDDVGGFIRNDMPISIDLTTRMLKPHCLHRTIVGLHDGIDAAPRVDLDAWRQQDARKIVGTNKRSTPSNKKDATLKVKHEKAGQVQQPGRSEAGHCAHLASYAVGWRSHSASTTMDSRVR
jgi:hypothetical protein